MFNIKVVRLTEAAGWDQKYGIGPVGGYGAVGGRGCDRHKNIFNLMIYLVFFIIVICFNIFILCRIYLEYSFCHQNLSYQLV